MKPGLHLFCDLLGRPGLRWLGLRCSAVGKQPEEPPRCSVDAEAERLQLLLGCCLPVCTPTRTARPVHRLRNKNRHGTANLEPRTKVGGVTSLTANKLGAPGERFPRGFVSSPVGEEMGSGLTRRGARRVQPSLYTRAHCRKDHSL